jgi:enoyl-CoA hydratase
MSTVRVNDVNGGVRVLTLDRPPANAISGELLDDLDAALVAASTDKDVRAVVLTGAGGFFSAGFDLKGSGGEPADMAVRYKTTNRRLLSLPKPTVAMIGGHCIAGGFVFAMACDHRIAAEDDYTIGVNEVAIGAAWPVVAMEIMRVRLSNVELSELMLGARLYPANEAKRLGLAHQTVPSAELEQKAMGRAAELAVHPGEVYANTKTRLVGDALARIDAATLEEDLAITALWVTEESQAARRRGPVKRSNV